MARKIRDGQYRGKLIRPMLPVLYEFPDGIARDPAKWQDPVNWPMVMPNLGRSVHLSTLVPDWETEKAKGVKAIAIWASQHLNIESGVGQKTDAWAGAEFWADAEDAAITLDHILEVCEAVVVSVDGGGLDDLYGLNVLGRERETRNWLSWSKAWCHDGVLERRKSIASRLLDFQQAGELVIYGEAGADIVEIIGDIKQRGLLAAVAVRPGRSRRNGRSAGRDRRHGRKQAARRRTAGHRHDERHQNRRAQDAEQDTAARAHRR